MKIFLDANICLDLLDSTRESAQKSIAWYRQNKDDKAKTFYFSGDFITTFYYNLTQKRKINAHEVIHAIDSLCEEIEPLYLVHSDFILAKRSFLQEKLFDDFEDLMVLHSALRANCAAFMTHDKRLLKLKKFDTIDLIAP
ncbi:MAG: PIN domain-containing protein [Campylobacterales bacterium]|nr:PIN domain-containing protein [Campylobacterales bacterium]